MLGWCVFAERLVICVLPNLGMGEHTMSVIPDGVALRLGSFRLISSGILVFDTLGWSLWFSVLWRHFGDEQFLLERSAATLSFRGHALLMVVETIEERANLAPDKYTMRTNLLFILYHYNNNVWN
jgi:hypothetical protein